MTLARFAFLLVVPLFVGCKTPDPPARCDLPFLGDPEKPIEIELLRITGEQKVEPVEACGPVDIVRPPQGGRVVFVGVRATNIDPCGVFLNGAVRDPATGFVLGAEERTINLRPVPGRAGWGESDASGDFENDGYASYANIAVCPNVDQVDVQRRAQRLDIKLEDRKGRKGLATTFVVPECGDRDPVLRAECECSCERDYTMEKCARVTSWDAGMPAPGACPPPDGGAGSDGGPPVDAGVPDGN